MRILHIFRAPVGGLFRHVRDLAKMQSQLGHKVGLICDSSGGGSAAYQLLAELAPSCSLGVERMPMPRLPGTGDLKPLGQIGALTVSRQPDIVHGHGAKGGLFARLAARDTAAKAVYTPHGGALHYSWATPQGAVFLTAEKLLLRYTSGLVFVCSYERDAFDHMIGLRNTPRTVVRNGLWPNEFEPISPTGNATDLLFVGELRKLKGADVLIKAIAELNKIRSVSATIVGDGPDRAVLEKLVSDRGLTKLVRFAGVLGAREAFGLGRVMIIPSRAESFPYVVLEAVAAELPIVASNVGGIPEILSKQALVVPDNVAALRQAIEHALDNPDEMAEVAKATARSVLKNLDVATMAQAIGTFYSELKSDNLTLKQ